MQRTPVKNPPLRATILPPSGPVPVAATLRPIFAAGHLPPAHKCANGQAGEDWSEKINF